MLLLLISWKFDINIIIYMPQEIYLINKIRPSYMSYTYDHTSSKKKCYVLSLIQTLSSQNKVKGNALIYIKDWN